MKNYLVTVAILQNTELGNLAITCLYKKMVQSELDEAIVVARQESEFRSMYSTPDADEIAIRVEELTQYWNEIRIARQAEEDEVKLGPWGLRESMEGNDWYFCQLDVSEKCKLCGETMDAGEVHRFLLWCTDMGLARTEYRCRSCRYWISVIRESLNGERVIVDGQHYTIVGDGDGAVGRGFGGRKFVIEFFEDGRRVETENLWTQGLIPERFREALPDNAKFVKVE